MCKYLRTTRLGQNVLVLIKKKRVDVLIKRVQSLASPSATLSNCGDDIFKRISWNESFAGLVNENQPSKHPLRFPISREKILKSKHKNKRMKKESLAPCTCVYFTSCVCAKAVFHGEIKEGRY